TVLAAAGFAAMPFTSYAQTTDWPSAMRWKGVDVNTLDEEFLLYNVGTGKFMTAGGGWGVQGMMLYQDFGTMMGLVSNGNGTYVIKSNVENGDFENAKYLGINYPGYTSTGTWGDHTNTFAPIMEAQSSGTEPVTYSRKWTFERVEGISDSYVYNMKETITASGNSDLELYMGASYGVNPEKGPDRGCDVFVGDTATFTTTEVFNSTFASGNEKAAYYQWILVPKSEIMDVYNKSIEAGGGLNANFTYLVTDPMFDRNHGKFSAWTDSIKGSGTETGKRYDWLNNKTMPEKNWDAADFQKVSIESKENGKYSFASFDGIGEVSQTFKAPVTGVYEIECRGFYQGHEAKLFVTVNGKTRETRETPLVNTGNKFTKCTLASKKYGGTNVTDSMKIIAGKALYDNENGQYTVKVVISATADDDIKIGIKKDAATKSKVCDRTWEWFETYYYYYDTDYVGVDNFAVRYVGKSKASIFVLDEDSTSEDYMKKATGKAYEDVTVYLKRSFTLNKWNSFVTPVGLTNAQVKQAFGDDVKVAKLAGVGGVTGNESSIDFRTVDLSQEGIAIEPAQMYLVKPTKDGVDMNMEFADGTPVSGKMYLIGRRSLEGSKITDGTLKIKPTYGKPAEGAEITGAQVDFMGTYVALDATNGPQAGAYAWSGGDMYHLKKANAIKGFRGWLVDHTGNNSIKFNIGDGSVTSIDEVIANDRAEKTSDAVYTVDGVKIRDNASSLEGLPAGLYIFKGKTHLVK
ncbi:MAG: hypothetical protein SO210_07830, partial [Bacteroidaceae bacterium]|nr:hypothetical protein [Bacteroidaceae bacterium]